MPPALRDPRSHRRYAEASAAYIARAPHLVTCALCGEDVDTTLPRTHRRGPTIEHRLPVRTILATCSTQAEALTLACDQNLWDIAHSECQSRQGAGVTNARGAPVGTPSRDWGRSF